MQSYEIITRRLMAYAGQPAEIATDAPHDLRTWTCRAFFFPSGKASELKPPKQAHIDITKVGCGC
jgi:hypothetical protein